MEKVVLNMKLLLNMEEIERLEFTYDQPFHMSQRHSKLSINQRKPSGKMQ